MEVDLASGLDLLTARRLRQGIPVMLLGCPITLLVRVNRGRLRALLPTKLWEMMWDMQQQVVAVLTSCALRWTQSATSLWLLSHVWVAVSEPSISWIPMHEGQVAHHVARQGVVVGDCSDRGECDVHVCHVLKWSYCAYPIIQTPSKG